MPLTKTIIDVNSPLTTEEKAEIEALKKRSVIPDEDCPEMTESEIDFYDYLHEKYKTRKITKEIILNEMAYLSKLVQSFPNVIKTLDISLKEGVIF